MSNKLTKILTYCSLVLVILAVVITTAICLTTALSYKVTVDVVLQSATPDAVSDANITVSVGGKEVSTQNQNTSLTVDVQKDREVTITFSMSDYNYVGLYNGSKDDYQGTESILNEPEEYVYKFVATKDTNYTLVCEAANFYQVSVGYNADKAVNEVPGGAIEVALTGDGAYADSENQNLYYVREGAQVSATYKAAEYNFTGWTNGENTSAENVYKLTVNENANIMANFEAYVYYNVKVDYKFDAKIELGSVKVTANGQQVGEDGLTLRVLEGENVLLKVENVAGYKFVNWSNISGEDATATSIKIAVTDNADYTANFTPIKYNITYVDGETQTTEQVLYGGALKEGPEESYQNGWKIFQGWTYGGKVYTTALFEGSNEDYTLTASYKTQSDITYAFNLGDSKSITYNTATGIDLTNAPSREYYKLAGINLNGVVYKFNDANGFADAQNTIDKYLMDQDQTAFDAIAIWELVGENITITVESDAIGATEYNKILAADIDVETTLLCDYLEIDTTNLASIKIMYNNGEHYLSKESAEGYAALTIADLFEAITFTPDVTDIRVILVHAA